MLATSFTLLANYSYLRSSTDLISVGAELASMLFDSIFSCSKNYSSGKNLLSMCEEETDELKLPFLERLSFSMMY
jgi:hypothetical protein